MPRNPKKKSNLALKPNATALDPPEPYPDFPFPTPEQCRAARDGLLSHHGFPEEFSSYRRDTTTKKSHSESVLDGLVSILLSQNTTDVNSRRAFSSLKSVFPSWEQVADAETKCIEDAIRCGGLAVTKAARIKSILKTLREKRGEISLDFLRGLSIAEVKAELSHFKGIGPKTVACLLMFHLQQDDFPVDTHVFRITKSIGWVPTEAAREKAYLHLNKRIPDELKFDLNCLLVTHGKCCQRCTLKGGSHTRVCHSSCPLL